MKGAEHNVAVTAATLRAIRMYRAKLEGETGARVSLSAAIADRFGVIEDATQAKPEAKPKKQGKPARKIKLRKAA